MTAITSVQAVAGGDPVFVVAGALLEAFQVSTALGSMTVLTLGTAGKYKIAQRVEPQPSGWLSYDDELESDIRAGLAALEEPTVASWEAVKERLGL